MVIKYIEKKNIKRQNYECANVLFTDEKFEKIFTDVQSWYVLCIV